MNIRIAVMVCGAVLASALGAAAQTWDDRFFLNVSVGANAGSTDSTLDAAPVVYGEAGELTVRRSVGGPVVFDVTAGRPIFGNLGVAISYSASGSTDDAEAAGGIPDPIFFDRPRPVAFSISDLDHSERWVGIHAAWFIPVGERLDAVVFAGPAMALVSHDVPSDVAVTESGSTPVVAVTIRTEDKTFAGFQVGADVRYMLTDMVGVGGFARFSGASGKILGDAELDLQRFQVGAGIRLKF